MSIPPNNHVQTLAAAAAAGELPPINRIVLRAQLSMVEEVTARGVRTGVDLLLTRLKQYYAVIGYTGPGYVYGRIDSEWPSALYAAAVHNYMNGNWMHQEMSPAHPSCPPENVFNAAGWMCLDTACRVAIHEMCTDVPEAYLVLNQARYAIHSMCLERKVSGTDWRSSRRRIRAAGILKVLNRLSINLSSIAIGIGTVRPVVLVDTNEAGRSALTRITDWSCGTCTALAA